MTAVPPQRTDLQDHQLDDHYGYAPQMYGEYADPARGNYAFRRDEYFYPPFQYHDEAYDKAPPFPISDALPETHPPEEQFVPVKQETVVPNP